MFGRKKARGARGLASLVGGTAGWKAVEVGDELLLGAEEGGFAGLEVLEDYTLLAEDPPTSLDASQEAPGAADGDGPQEHEHQANPKKRKRKDKADLKARLKALQQENATLKAQLGSPAGASPAASNPDSQPPGKPQAKKARTGQQQGAAATKESAGAQEGQKEEDVEVSLADVSAWRPMALHPLIEQALARLGFTGPTPIQAAVIPAALRDGRDVIGAAQTGSGKTLAFGLPIMQRLLHEREAAAATGDEPANASKLRALVLAPTRELALQVCKHLQAVGKVAAVRVVAIVGGLAQVKQERLLRGRPAVVVATPGRLWELLRDRASPHLSDLSALSFLVLDEADRMVQKGHFQELSSILALVPRPGQARVTYDADFLPALQLVEAKEAARRAAGRPADDYSGDEEEGVEEEEEEGGGGSGDLRVEAEGQHPHSEEEEEDADEEGDDGVQDMDALARAVAVQAAQAPPAAGTSPGGKGRGGRQKPGPEAGGSADKVGKGGGGVKGRGPGVQTMVFSATLTLPAHLRQRLKSRKGGAMGGTDLDTLMDKVPFRGTPHIIDLSSSKRLASGVSQAYVHCLEGADRDATLYYLLLRHPGRTLVFVNAVSALRRVAALLKLLGMPAHALHAQQQQRQRLNALDRFTNNPNSVLVATDVAARGLDINDIRLVVHYQLPASLDTYIHRCGRTGRGAASEGLAVALVAAEDSGRWRALCRSLHGADAGPDVIPSFPVDATLMPKVVERVKLAERIDEAERAGRKEAAETAWAERTAAEIGLQEGSEGSTGRKRGKAGRGPGIDDDDDDALRRQRIAKQQAAAVSGLKAQLAALVAQPLAPRMSAAFFTGGAMAGVQLSGSAARGGGGQEEGAGAGMANAVGIATKIRDATAAARAAAPQKPPQKKLKVMSVEQLAKQELLRRKAVKAAKRGKGAAVATVTPRSRKAGGGLVVIPPTRDTQGQDALAALRRKLAALG